MLSADDAVVDSCEEYESCEEGMDAVPQSQPLAANQVPNNAGGFTWKVDDMKRLHRFLCLGCENGTYYATEKDLGVENAACIARLIDNGQGVKVLEELVKFSVEGRTAKQNPLIFCLAMLARQDKDKNLKKQAYQKLSDICRIPTQLFQFIEYCEKLSKGTGWGRAHRKGIATWYLNFSSNPKRLAMHVTKYKNRNGWTHRDVVRLAHPKTDSEGVAAVIKYIIKGLDKAKEELLKENASTQLTRLFDFLQAVEDIKTCTSPESVIYFVKEQKLVREHIPTKFLNDITVWSMLLENMPMTAMIRNLGKMTSIGLLEHRSNGSCTVIGNLTDEKRLKEARIHPFNVLLALKTYEKGQGEKGKLTWKPDSDIVKALNNAFYLAFKFVESTNQRYLLALDVSGSMDYYNVNGSSTISARVASAAMSMVTARTEENYSAVAFSTNLVPLKITPKMSLGEVEKAISDLPFGGTDCAQPMLWAKKYKKEFDVFIVYTDCETWAGKTHPAEALRAYRKSSGIWNAKLIVCAMTSNGFTLADPEDPGMMDMAGFDSSGPEIMRNFVLGII